MEGNLGCPTLSGEFSIMEQDHMGVESSILEELRQPEDVALGTAEEFSRGHDPDRTGQRLRHGHRSAHPIPATAFSRKGTKAAAAFSLPSRLGWLLSR